MSWCAVSRLDPITERQPSKLCAIDASKAFRAISPASAKRSYASRARATPLSATARPVSPEIVGRLSFPTMVSRMGRSHAASTTHGWDTGIRQRRSPVNRAL